MKLYVWNNPYRIAYGGSCLYVLAPNLTAARKAALKAVDAGYGDPYSDGRTMKLDKLGDPDRVENGPYAEVYHWAE